MKRLAHLIVDRAQDALVQPACRMGARVYHLIRKGKGQDHTRSLCGQYPAERWYIVDPEDTCLPPCAACLKSHANVTHDATQRETGGAGPSPTYAGRRRGPGA